MTISVQNNSSALLALQTLNRLNDPLQQTGDPAVSTAQTVQTATDSAILSVSPSSASDGGALNAISASLDRAASITDVALAAGQSVSDLLAQMKQAATAVEGGGLSSSDQTGLNTDFAGLLKQLSDVVAGAQFDGVNLLDGSSSAGASVAIGGGSGGAVTLAAQNLSLGGPVITVASGADISTQTAAASVLDQVDASIANVGSALGQIGDQASQIQAHASFVSRLSGVLAAGASPSASGGLSADGARLMALQVQQQLAGQTSGIANSAPQVLLSLFK